MNISGFKILLIILLFGQYQNLISGQSVPETALIEIRQKISRCIQYHPRQQDGQYIDTDKPNFDGPIDPDKWYISSRRNLKTDDRIMFVLKEPWGNGNIDWPKVLKEDYRSLTDFRDGGLPTYKPMIIIANMIGKQVTYNSVINDIYSQNSYTVFKESCGIMEVNKFSGGTRSSDYIITDYARKNLDLLSEQIDVYNPTIVIIGIGRQASEVLIKEVSPGRFEIFGDTVMANKTKLEYPKSLYCCSYATNKRIYIVTYHPSAIVNKEQYCNAIYEAVRLWKLKYQ